MAHEFPLSLPATPAFSNSTWGMKRAVAVAESPFTGAQQVHEYDYSLWRATLTLPPMKREQAAEWQAFILKLRGRYGTFLLCDPDAKNARGAVTGTPTLTSNITVGQHEISITTENTSTDNVFKVGDYIQIGVSASAKLHMIVSTSNNSNLSGQVTVSVEPFIKQDATSGTSVIVSNPKGVFRMDSSDLGWDSDFVSKYGFSFSCAEAI